MDVVSDGRPNERAHAPFETRATTNSGRRIWHVVPRARHAAANDIRAQAWCTCHTMLTTHPAPRPTHANRGERINFDSEPCTHKDGRGTARTSPSSVTRRCQPKMIAWKSSSSNGGRCFQSGPSPRASHRPFALRNATLVAPSCVAQQWAKPRPSGTCVSRLVGAAGGCGSAAYLLRWTGSLRPSAPHA